MFRNAEDPNDVVILQDVADVAKARTWLGSDEMKASDAEERRGRLTTLPLRGRGLSRSGNKLVAEIDRSVSA